MPRTSFRSKPATPVALTLLATVVLGLTGTPAHASIKCADNPACSCVGDDDCNTMIEKLCKPGTESCTGSGDTAECSCEQKANIVGGNPRRHPIHTPPRFPVHGGPVHGRPIHGTPIYGKPIISKPIPKKPPTSSGPVVLERSGPKH